MTYFYHEVKGWVIVRQSPYYHLQTSYSLQDIGKITGV